MALSSFLFSIVSDVLTKDVRKGKPWEMCTDNVALVSNSKDTAKTGQVEINTGEQMGERKLNRDRI